MKKAFKIVSVVFLSIILIVLSLCLIFNIVYFKTNVEGLSMYPTLNAGEEAHDRIFVNKFEHGKVGDIVIADTINQENWVPPISEDGKEERYVVKTLVAVEGDKVKIEKVDDTTYNLIVNNKTLYSKEIIGLCPTYEDFITYVTLNSYDNSHIEDGYIILQKNEIFLLGDNWLNSYDCADCGPIRTEALIGRVDIIVPKDENIVFGAIKGIFKQIF